MSRPVPSPPSFRPVSAGIVLACLSAGCGGEAGELAPVRGTVSYRGAALPGGTVVFTPDASRGGSGPLAHAEIQADGTYTLQTDGRPGASAGWHRVSVATARAREAGHPPLPPRYSDPELSGISYQVRPGQANTIDLRLE